MAKSNLKTLNNNFVTQFTPCSMNSRYSYIYITYIYLSFLFFSLNFFIGSQSYINKNYMYKNTSNLNTFSSNYTNFFIDFLHFKKFNKRQYNVSYKLLSYNGSFTNIFDFFIIKFSNIFLTRLVKAKNINLYNFKFSNKPFISNILK